jgi:hypothetical protein
MPIKNSGKDLLNFLMTLSNNFTVFGAESYREDADKKSWKRFIEFLDDTLK